jgi:hypothetical protein
MLQQRVEEDLKVDYQVFRSLYWPRFPQYLTKGLSKLFRMTSKCCRHSSSVLLDPALVWSEFLGVIRGSEDSLISTSGYMDRDAYEHLSHRTQATFAQQRGRVYDLFQIYVRQKRMLEGYDVADRFVPFRLCLFPSLTVCRTHALLQAVRTNGKLPGIPVDFLCVQMNLKVHTISPHSYKPHLQVLRRMPRQSADRYQMYGCPLSKTLTT